MLLADFRLREPAGWGCFLLLLAGRLLVKSIASDWSSRMQSRGQVECTQMFRYRAIFRRASNVRSEDRADAIYG